MTITDPPRIATWLAERLVSGPQRDSLVGDLVEQFQMGRSVAWYWRQVLVAIVLSAARDVGAHKWLAGRALAIGWTVYLLGAFPAILFTGVARSWVAGWLDMDHYSPWRAFLADHLPQNVVIWIVCAASGWLVARCHRSHAAAMVGVYAASIFLFEYGMVSYMFARYGFPRGAQPLMIVLPAILGVGRPLSILLGGLWSIRSDGGVHDQVAMS